MSSSNNKTSADASEQGSTTTTSSSSSSSSTGPATSDTGEQQAPAPSTSAGTASSAAAAASSSSSSSSPDPSSSSTTTNEQGGGSKNSSSSSSSSSSNNNNNNNNNAEESGNEQAAEGEDEDDDSEDEEGEELVPYRDHKEAPVRKLSVKLLDTYRHINQVYYAEKNKRKQKYDDRHDNYIIKAGEEFNERFTLKKQVGKGSFGVVAHASDNAEKCDVAIKIIKSQRPFAKQAQTEIRLLEFMRDKNKDNAHGIVCLKEYFRYRSHVCLVFEYLGDNLYELIKKTGFAGLPLTRVAHLGAQLLDALAFLSREDIRIIHCDLKPENILLCPGPEDKIKIIDFGSSCFYTNKMYEYIQSRFYRSPEVILGIPYDEAIDMWSLGCILYELHTGAPLFGGQNEEQQMQYICALKGYPPASMLAAAKHSKLTKIFVEQGVPPVDVPVPGDKRSVDGKRSEGEISADMKSAAALAALAEKETQQQQALKEDNGGGGGGGGGGGAETVQAAAAATADGGGGGGEGGGFKDSDSAKPETDTGDVDSAAAPTVEEVQQQAPQKRYRLKYSKKPTTLAEKLHLKAGGPEAWRLPSEERAAEVYAPFVELVTQMLTYQPALRIKPLKALEHPFIVDNVVTSTELRPFEDSMDADASAASISEDDNDVGEQSLNM